MIVAIAVAAGVVELGQPDDDQERRDLRDEGDVAGDEDDRAVFADGAGERQREAGQERRQERREDDAEEGLPARWRRAWRPPPPTSRLDVLQHRLHACARRRAGR